MNVAPGHVIETKFLNTVSNCIRVLRRKLPKCEPDCVWSTKLCIMPNSQKNRMTEAVVLICSWKGASKACKNQILQKTSNH